MINVTKTFLPPIEDYIVYLREIWDSKHITNRSPLVILLEKKLKSYLGVKNLLFVSNGTIAIQLIIKALNLKGEIITTPFSYVATTSTILWEDCKAVFVDIEPTTFCIDATLIEKSITPNTVAILATHVYGHSCNVEKIQEIADKYGLKVIYDAAHAFGINHNGHSILNFGNASTLSFHATKVFHTVEGGAVITNDDELFEKITLLHQFGHTYDEYYYAGINAKNSDFHAAMGLCNLSKINQIITKRNEIIAQYNKLLEHIPVQRPIYYSSYNGSYYPIIFNTEQLLLKVKEDLSKENIFTRRYFYPSLNLLPYVNYSSCPVSEDISKRVLCLPLFYELDEADQTKIVSIIRNSL